MSRSSSAPREGGDGRIGSPNAIEALSGASDQTKRAERVCLEAAVKLDVHRGRAIGVGMRHVDARARRTAVRPRRRARAPATTARTASFAVACRCWSSSVVIGGLLQTGVRAIVAARAPSGNPPTDRLRTVVGVDADVVVRQVAGPHGGAGRAAVQVDAHGDLALLHHALAVLFAVVRMAAALRRDVHVVEEEVDQALVEVVDAGIADRREDAARGSGRWRRTRSSPAANGRSRRPPGGTRASSRPPSTLHGDELGRAFAVAHDRLRELRAPPRPPRRAAARLRPSRARSIARMAGAAGGDQHERVVGRGVAVDRDAVERAVGRLAHQRLQQRRARSPRRWRRSRASSPCSAGSCRRPWRCR